MAYLASVLLAGCGGGGGETVVVDPSHSPFLPVYEELRHPTNSGLEYFNSATCCDLHLTSVAGEYVSYTGGDIVTFVLGDILPFTVPGDLSHPFSSLYEAERYSVSTLHTDTAVENLMAFLMGIDDDGDYTNGIQIAAPVRSAA